MAVHSRISPPPQHQVFVNFRGDELRGGFVSHLVEALQRHQINAFIDEFETRGVDFTNLLVRIEESTVALVIFSPRYTESVWCLDELAKINESSNQGLLKVFPIFFNVEPDTVTQLKGVFGNEFKHRERECWSDKTRIEKWKEALASVPCKAGLIFKMNSKESIFVRTIVEEVEKMLPVPIDFPLQGRRSNEGAIEKEHSCLKALAFTPDPAEIPIKTFLVQKKSKIENRIVVVSNYNMDIEYENSVLREYIELSVKLQSLEMVHGILPEELWNRRQYIFLKIRTTLEI